MRYFYTSVFLLTSIMVSCQNKSNKTIDLSSIKNKKSIIVYRGDELTFTGQIYESVGWTLDYTIDNKKILQYEELEKTYKNKMVEGQTGGDDATGTYFFKAIAKGKTKLIIRKLFRGDLEKEYVFNIEVK